MRLGDYYLLEAANAGAATLFQMAVYFWTRRRLGFGDSANLWLGATQGVFYVVCAYLGGKLAERAGYDRLLGWSVALAAAVLPLLPAAPRPATPYIVMALYSAAVAATWPALEAAIFQAPGRWTTPQRLAAYNVVWSLAGGIGFFISGAVFAWRTDAIAILPMMMHLAQLVWMAWRRRQPAGPADGIAPADAVARQNRARRHPRFMHVAWLGNMLGFFVLSGFSALSPHLGERLGLAPRQAIWLVCALFLARGLSFAAFGWWEGWHYRRRWLAGAIILLPPALATAFFSPRTGAVLAANVVMGVLMGLIYSSSLFYSLDIGENKGEHGGLHEAMLGCGTLAGPLTGVAGASLLPRLLGNADMGGAAGAKLAILGICVPAAAVAAGLVLAPAGIRASREQAR